MDAPESLVSLFGSETRARVLVVLANARGGLSAYRISKLSGAQPIKVSRELARLMAAGLVEKRSLRGARRTWLLRDQDLRSFLSKRVRISWSEDWFGGELGAGSNLEAVCARLEELPTPNLAGYAWKQGPPKLLKEFDRPPEKDRILRRLGLRTSPRESLRRKRSSTKIA